MHAAAGTVVFGFSSPHDELVPPGGTVEIKRSVAHGYFRPERLEIRPRSAIAFDLVGGQLGPRILIEGGEAVVLAALPSSQIGLKFAPRSLTLPHFMLGVGMSIKATLRNISDKPARFCANLIGMGTES